MTTTNKTTKKQDDDSDSNIDIEDDSGCEEDPDGGPNTDAGDIAPRGDYYTLTDGAHWVYRHFGAGVWDEEVELRQTTHQGEVAFALSDNVGPNGTRGTSILVLNGNRVLRVAHDEFSDNELEARTTYDPGFVRFDAIWLEQSVGFTETLNYRRIQYSPDGVVLADGNRSHRFTLLSISAVAEVVAGRFDDCIQVLRSRVRDPGVEKREGDEDMFWFCPGVGKVLEEDQFTGEREELVTCEISGGACPL